MWQFLKKKQEKSPPCCHMHRFDFSYTLHFSCNWVYTISRSDSLDKPFAGMKNVPLNVIFPLILHCSWAINLWYSWLTPLLLQDEDYWNLPPYLVYFFSVKQNLSVRSSWHTGRNFKTCIKGLSTSMDLQIKKLHFLFTIVTFTHIYSWKQSGKRNITKTGKF